MNIKSKKDILFVDFLRFSEEIKEDYANEIFVADKVIEIFFPDVKDNEAMYVELFDKALKAPVKSRFPYQLIKIKKAGKFIDADTYAIEGDLKELLNVLVKPIWPWQKFDVNKISLADAEHALNSFISGQANLSNSTNLFITRPYKQILKL